jgi:hypothetical protein
MHKFGDIMLPVALELSIDGVSPSKRSKLLALLTEKQKMWTLKIELSAYVESLKELRDLCYFLEGDDTDMVFQAADRVECFVAKFPGGSLGPLPSTERLIQEAISWAITDGGFKVPDEGADSPVARPTIADIEERVREQVVAERPRRKAAAIESVRNAVLAASETVAARNKREQAMLREQEKEAQEAVRIAELEKEAQHQANAPPLTPDAWRAHIVSGIAPAVHYFTSRCCDSKGDRFVQMQVFQAARLFNPHFAKSLSYDEAEPLLEMLREYDVLNQAGESNIVNALKESFNSYRHNASQVIKKFNYDQDKAGILTWHYRQYLKLDAEKAEDRKAGKCRYCRSVSNRCKCNANLEQWWRAAKLLVLLMPSSGAAERVFSLLNNFVQ